MLFITEAITTTKPLNQNRMIIVKCNDKNIGEIKCESMYEAHTWKIYLNANGYECEVLNNGESINLSNEIQHPNSY
jgi:hypothetical protein